jgi:hypothetical protein
MKPCPVSQPAQRRPAAAWLWARRVPGRSEPAAQLDVFFVIEHITRRVHILGVTTLWVPETVLTAADLPDRRRPGPGIIHRWRCG